MTWFPPSPLEVEGRKYLPCDVDVSPFDNSGSHREGIGRTYKGTDGFAPIFAYLGTEGWMINHELRPGTCHCQKGTPDFLRHTLERIASLKPEHQVLFRLDSGNDAAENVQILRDSDAAFIIKRNLRREDPVKWLSHAMSQGPPECPREGKQVYIGTAEHHKPGGKDSPQAPLTSVYRVTCQTIDKHGHELLFPKIEVETWWTNLGESPETIIALYRDHGTSEQFHSELKSDMNLERFASHDYRINTLWLRLAVLAYNLLRCLDRMALRWREKAPQSWPKRIKDVARRRVGSIIRDLILVGCKRVNHAGRKILKLPRSWPWSAVILALNAEVQAL